MPRVCAALGSPRGQREGMGVGLGPGSVPRSSFVVRIEGCSSLVLSRPSCTPLSTPIVDDVVDEPGGM